MFTPQDLSLFASKGIDTVAIQRQIEHFCKGFPFIRLVRPATPGDGIMTFTDQEKAALIENFDREQPGLSVVKFVPASGAASRMFKHLFEFREKYTNDETGESLFRKDQGFNSVFYLIQNLHHIAFFDKLAEAAGGISEVKRLIGEKEYNSVINRILDDDGLEYANLPKALILFHRYADGSRTSAEEHMAEAVVYATDRERVARTHFTISPEHRSRFDDLTRRVVPQLVQKHQVKLDISFSIQNPSTDIIAVDEQNEPFRSDSGTLLFRPGGHGALLENLNHIQADIIFIKNIDNVVPDSLKPETYRYKKLLGGFLLSMREKIFGFLQKLETGAYTHEDLVGMTQFAAEQLYATIPTGFATWSETLQKEFLFNCFNRPMRVCGMVKNEGEPGGGPFWVAADDGTTSLQIVESAQIDMKNPGQQAIANSATHFNPVDLVCSTRNFRGDLFNLQDFVDENTGLISTKSSGGRTLKAQELPGLWNGSMAYWITWFIEVPIITFNPVKTVNDLLRREHLA